MLQRRAAVNLSRSQGGSRRRAGQPNPGQGKGGVEASVGGVA
jgi:hypothetical protein